MEKRILLIEDEESVRDTIELLLSQAGYLVNTCSTGKNIFNTIEKSNPDLILLDILLGELDGRDICKAIKSNPLTSNIPIIVVSGVYNIYNIILEEKANDVIVKPFVEETLLSRVKRQLSDTSLVS